MDTLMALQNLAVTVNGLKESIHLTATRVSTISNENNQRASTYHSKFGELLGKYSGFANEYKFELDNLHKSLLNDIHIQQKEREEQEREYSEKLETLSNKSSHSNLEIVENVEETEYHSSGNSVNMNNMNCPQNREDSEFEHSQNTVSMNIPIDAIPSEPQPMKSKKSITISQPKPKKNKNKNRNKNKNKLSKKSKGRNNRNQNKAKSVNNMNNMNKPAAVPKAKASTSTASTNTASITTAPKQQVVRTLTADIENKEEEIKEDKYVYNAKNVEWNIPFTVYNQDTEKYDAKVYKHTTMIYIGNIPSNIKTAAMQFFIMKKFKVSMRQIEETKLQKGRGYTQFALVRFRSDVPLDHITKHMNMLNSENARIKDDKKAAQDTMHIMTKKKDKDGDDKKKNKKIVKTSWRTQVFIKFQDPEYHYSYYENEDAMYNDNRAKHSLFIRNFDVLNKKCHKELTDKLLSFGDLVKDINIKLDQYDDPYCIVVFKYINDAVYCCNSDIYFGGRRLEIRYSKY